MYESSYMSQFITHSVYPLLDGLIKNLLRVHPVLQAPLHHWGGFFGHFGLTGKSPPHLPPNRLHSSDFDRHRPHLSEISTALGIRINVLLLQLPVKPLFADFSIVRWHRQLWVDELNRSQDNNIHLLIVPTGKMAHDSSRGEEYRDRILNREAQILTPTGSGLTKGRFYS